MAGIDVVRDEAGELRVLEDNIRCPSGVSYVLANRAAMARVLPEVFWGRPIHLVADYPARLVRALRLAAPGGVTDPTVVVLTPGVYNSAFYEHALLARLMGVHLVEGRDLVCHGTDVFLRTTEGEVPVHVVYRRVDDDYIDPLQFRPDSLVGCPGLLNAARAGRVTVANAVGQRDRRRQARLLVRAGHDPLLPRRGPGAPERRDVPADSTTTSGPLALRRRRELVFKRVDGSGGKGLVIGPYATPAELDEVAAAVERSPRSWVAQRMVAAVDRRRPGSAAAWRSRHVDLRPFAVNDGERVWVLPGGLTRVALQEGGLVVNSSQGGGSKDTWVVDHRSVRPAPSGAGRPAPARGRPAAGPVPVGMGPPMDAGPPIDAEQGQQQQ